VAIQQAVVAGEVYQEEALGYHGQMEF